MKITKEEVLYVTHLARLDLDAESIEKFAGQIDEILGYIEKLNQVDTRKHKTNIARHLFDQCVSRRSGA